MLIGEFHEGIWKEIPTLVTMLGEDITKCLRKSINNSNNNNNNQVLSPFVGLRNLGNTCFLNVVIQTLFHNVMIRDAILNINDIPDDKDFYESIKQLQLAFGHMSLGNNSIYNVVDFVNLLKLNVDEQQDPQEFTKLYLTRVALLTANTTDRDRPTISQLLSGQESHITQCMKCKSKKERSTAFHELDLPIEGCSTLDAAIEAYFQKEKLDGDNMYFCEECSIKVSAERCSKVSRWPPVLSLQLLRYVYDKTTWTKRKVKTEITFPDKINLPYCDEEYHLVGIIYHVGNSAHNGHYVTEVLDWESGGWYFCDDDTVVPVPYIPTSKSKEISPSNNELDNFDDEESPKETETKKGKEKRKATAETKKRKKKEDSSPDEDEQSHEKENDEKKAIKSQIELQSLKKLNRPKEVYSLTYISSSLLQQGKKSQRLMPSEQLQQVIRNSNSLFQKKVSEYEKNRSVLQTEIDARKNLYLSIRKNMVPKKGESYRLVPKMWLSQWIRGDKIHIKDTDIKDKKDSSREVINIDDIDKGTNGYSSSSSSSSSSRNEVNLVSPIKSSNNNNFQDESEYYYKVPQLFCEPIHSIESKCKHGEGLPPSEIENFKVLSTSAYSKIVESIEVDFEWSKENVICETCDGISSQAAISTSKRLKSYENIEDLLKQVKKADKTYLISKTWVTNFQKSSTKQKFQKLCHETSVSTIDKQITENTSSSFVNSSSSSDGSIESLLSQLLDPTVNSKLSCEHGNLQLNYKRSSQEVSADAWAAVHELFPSAITYKSDTDTCPLCSENKVTSKEENEKDQIYRKSDLSEKALSNLFKRKKKYPTEFDNQVFVFSPRESILGNESRFMIIESNWLNRWKEFVGGNGNRPSYLSNNSLRCQCGKGILVNDTLSAIASSQVPSSENSFLDYPVLPEAEIISEEQWNLLKQLYPSEDCFEVSLSLSDQDTWLWSPDPCPTCTDEMNRSVEEQKINFENRDLKVIIATDISQCVDSGFMETTSRSSRKRKVSSSFVISASSTDSIFDIKMKICGRKDYAPNQQSLYCNSTQLSKNNKQLKDYNVTATDTIYVMINEEDEDFFFDDDGNVQKEHGFAGTMLFGSKI